MHDVTGFLTEALEEIMEEIMDVAERWGVKGLKIWRLEKCKNQQPPQQRNEQKTTCGDERFRARVR